MGGSPCFRKDLIKEPQVHLGVCLLTSNLRHQFSKFLEDPNWSNHNVNPRVKVYWFLLGFRTCLNVRDWWFVGQGRVMKSPPYLVRGDALNMSSKMRCTQNFKQGVWMQGCKCMHMILITRNLITKFLTWIKLNDTCPNTWKCGF